MSSTQTHLDAANEGHQHVSALFLGPRAENDDLLMECFQLIVQGQKNGREQYTEGDGDFITASLKGTQGYSDKKEETFNKLGHLLFKLGKHSVPFYSPRYSGHMSSDQTLPSILGYLSTMFYNPNNVSIEASPLTTQIEMHVGLDLCELLGYDRSKSWGHIACDGTVANIESVWASRNLKFYPLSLRDAMRPGEPLDFIAATFEVELCRGDSDPVTKKLLTKCSTWQLLNLKESTILEIPERLLNEYQISPSFVDEVMKHYIVQSISKDEILKKWGIEQQPVLFVPATKHYSWPKAAAITGIGSDNAVDVPVDYRARMDVEQLKTKLMDCIKQKRAVYEVVAVIGTTEEGAVDRLKEIIELRNQLNYEGLSFVVHADAAWGGYFATMMPGLKAPRDMPGKDRDIVLSAELRQDTVAQYRALKDADSITIDPHKAGYVPYPAGGLCYKGQRMKNLLTWTAPYLNQGNETSSIGIFGVEGSKPGAAASAVYLANHVVGLNRPGYGRLLGEASFTSRQAGDKFITVPLDLLPSEAVEYPNPELIDAEKAKLRQIIRKENSELADSDLELLNTLGSDTLINVFVSNFFIENGTLNTDVDAANDMNRRIFERLSITSSSQDPLDVPFFLSSSTFAQEEYGACASYLKQRLGLKGEADLFVLRNVVMSPFATAGNFVEKLAEDVKVVISEEAESARKAAFVDSTVHNFVVQGSERPYLVLQPSFDRASERYQCILSAQLEVNDPANLDNLLSGTKNVFLKNVSPFKLKDLKTGYSFDAEIYAEVDSNKMKIRVSEIEIIKRRSLTTEDLTSTPTMMPFYLYGSSKKLFIDHILLTTPNIQLTASLQDVSKNLKMTSDDELSKGLIVIAKSINELSMQPFSKDVPLSDSFFFKEGSVFHVGVFKDPFDSIIDPPSRLIDMYNVKDKVASDTYSLASNVNVVQLSTGPSQALPKATETAQTFFMQGTDKLHLVYQPASGQLTCQYQFICSANVGEDAMAWYMARLSEKKKVFIRTTSPLSIEDLDDGSSFQARMFTKDGNGVADAEVSALKVVKKRSLNPDVLGSIPTHMPFYLYGTPEQLHIDHVILSDPTVQLTASVGPASQGLLGKVSEADLAAGLIVKARTIDERTMRPIAGAIPDSFFFGEGAKFEFDIYKDPFPKTISHPADRIDLRKVTDVLVDCATLKIGKTFIDKEKINEEIKPFKTTRRGKLTQDTEKEWLNDFHVFHDKVISKPHKCDEVKGSVGRFGSVFKESNLATGGFGKYLH